MKLPGIERLGVQSLGRQDSSLAMQRGLVKGEQARVIGESLDQVNSAVQREIVEPSYQREAIAQYAKAESGRANRMTEAQSLIENPTGVVTPDQIPTWVDFREFDDDGAGNITRRTHIPTYEVAQEWYRGELKRSQQEVLSGMTNQQAIRKMKNDFGSAYLSDYASILLNAQKRKRDAELADVDMAVERFVEGGDQNKAEVLVLGAMKTGVIGPKEGAERLMAIPGDIDAYRVSRAINTSTIDELDGLETYIYRDYNTDEDGNIVLNEDGTMQQNPMTFDQRKTLVKELDARRKSLLSVGDLTKTANSAEQLNIELINLQDRDEALSNEELTTAGYRLTPEDHKTLIVANRALHSASENLVTDGRVMAQHQMAINDLASPRPGQTINQRRAAIINQINNSIDAGELNANDAWALIQRVNQTEERPFQTPDMDMAVDRIYRVITRGSKSAVGLDTSGRDAQLAADAELALFTAARNSGPGFDPLAWLDSPEGGRRFLTKHIMKNQQKAEKARVEGIVVYGDDNKPDRIATREKVKSLIGTGQYDDEELRERIATINRRIEEQELAEKQARDKDNGGSWWQLWR